MHASDRESDNSVIKNKIFISRSQISRILYFVGKIYFMYTVLATPLPPLYLGFTVFVLTGDC
jgi:hypothetical protein